MEILVVVDMQNDFIDGALGTAEAAAIVPAAVERIRHAAAGGAVILATRDTHGENYMDTQEGRNLPVPHCLRGTHGWELNEDIAAALPAGTEIFDKISFGSPELAARVAELVKGREAESSIEFIGLCTDICVVSNAFLVKAACPELPESVDASCCAGVTPAAHNAALATMASCQVKIR